MIFFFIFVVVNKSIFPVCAQTLEDPYRLLIVSFCAKNVPNEVLLYNKDNQSKFTRFVRVRSHIIM